MKLKISLSLLAVIATLAAGCASLGTPTEQTAEQLVVEYSTLKVISTGKTSADRQAVAARITKIASDAQTYLGSPSASVATVTQLVNAQIATLHLVPTEQILADALVQEVGADIAAKVGHGVLSPAQIVSVNTVLGWVKEAASFPVS